LKKNSELLKENKYRRADVANFDSEDEAAGYSYTGLKSMEDKIVTMLKYYHNNNIADDGDDDNKIIGGVMIWEVGQDLAPTHPKSLLSTITQVIEEAKRGYQEQQSESTKKHDEL